VGITGNKLCLRSLKYLAPVVIGVFLLMVGGAASAHSLINGRKERIHIKHRSLKQLGVPYAHGGASPAGFDCSGFTRWTFLTHGADLPHSAAWQFDLGSHVGYRRIWRRSHLLRGDLVFFHTTSSYIGHAGIYIGHGRFVSATSSSGVHVDSVYDSYYWGPRWVGATRLPATRRTNAANAATQQTDPSLRAPSVFGSVIATSQGHGL
jgi:NlpC/P60 family